MIRPTARSFTRSKVKQEPNAAPSSRPPIRGTLIVVAPRLHSGGVGDYAEDFISAASQCFTHFREVRTDGPGRVGIVDLIRDRRRLLQAVSESKENGAVVIHYE